MTKIREGNQARNPKKPKPYLSYDPEFLKALNKPPYKPTKGVPKRDVWKEISNMTMAEMAKLRKHIDTFMAHPEVASKKKGVELLKEAMNNKKRK